MSKSIAFSLVLFFYFKSFAYGANFSLGEPQFYGSGCHKNNTSFTLSPDSGVLSILFDEYKVEMDELSRHHQNKSNCLVVVPIKVPKGIQIGVSMADYRGYISIPKKSSANIISKIGMLVPNKRFPKLLDFASSGQSQKSFRGPADDEFNLRTKAKKIRYSSCGATAYLYFDSSMIVNSNINKDYSLIIMDSLDIGHKKGANVKFSRRNCR